MTTEKQKKDLEIFMTRCLGDIRKLRAFQIERLINSPEAKLIMVELAIEKHGHDLDDYFGMVSLRKRLKDICIENKIFKETMIQANKIMSERRRI